MPLEPEPEPETAKEVVEPPTIANWTVLRLREVRKLKGISQQSCARAMKRKRSRVLTIEKLVHRIHFKTFDWYRRAAGVPAEMVFDPALSCEEIARATAGMGGDDEDFIQELCGALPALDRSARIELLAAAKSLRKNQMPIVDWIRV
jgi:transcriptional regulator with XRE-family HTH domain